MCLAHRSMRMSGSTEYGVMKGEPGRVLLVDAESEGLTRSASRGERFKMYEQL